MPPSFNKNASGLPTAQTKDSHDIPTRRQAVVANPFPFPFIEDSGDEIVIDVKPHLSVVQDVGKYKERNPFSSPIVEDDGGEVLTFRPELKFLQGIGLRETRLYNNSFLRYKCISKSVHLLKLP